MYTTHDAPRRQGLAVLAVLGLSLALSACGLGDWDAPPGDSCLESAGTTMVGGEWRFTGEGKRIGCSDPALDAPSFDLASIPIVVGQYGTALRLEQGIPAIPTPAGAFSMTWGRVNGVCVDFETTETGPFGVIVYRFTGRRTPEGHITGTFDGRGPGLCETSGRFQVFVTCCAGTGPDAPTPPPVDVVDDVTGEDAVTPPADTLAADGADSATADASDADTGSAEPWDVAPAETTTLDSWVSDAPADDVVAPPADAAPAGDSL